MKQENMSIKRPEVGKLKDLAIEVNSIPLPNIPDTKQILLPPQEHSLIRNNFQIYAEELLKQFNLNLNTLENFVDKNDRMSEKYSQVNDGNVEDHLRLRSQKKDEDILKPLQTVLKRKKNREIKISLDLGKKKDYEDVDIIMNKEK